MGQTRLIPRITMAGWTWASGYTLFTRHPPSCLIRGTNTRCWWWIGLSKCGDRKEKIRAWKWAAYRPNCPCRWAVFGEHRMTKTCLSQHLMNSNLDFKKLLFLTFLKEMDDLVTLYPHFSTATVWYSNSCYFLLGQVFSISSQSPPLLFISPVIITLGWFFIKKLLCIFKCRSKMRKLKNFPFVLPLSQQMGKHI